MTGQFLIKHAVSIVIGLFLFCLGIIVGYQLHVPHLDITDLTEDSYDVDIDFDASPNERIHRDAF